MIVYFDIILVYIEDPSQPHIDVVRWVLKQLGKYGFITNLIKCRFQQDEVWILEFLITTQAISIDEERIETVKAWSERKSIRDFQVFLGFANFYQRFI